MGSRSHSRQQKDVGFRTSPKGTGKCEIEEVGLDHEESQYRREFLISRYKIHAYALWGVPEKVESYEVLFTYLFSHLASFSMPIKERMMLRVCTGLGLTMSNSLLTTKVDYLNCTENVRELNSNFPVSRRYKRARDLISLPNIFQFTSGNKTGPLMRLLRCGIRPVAMGWHGVATATPDQQYASFLLPLGIS